MGSLTRWVLAHKRIVVIVWLVVTLVGVASAGSATKALKQKFSVPGKEGWVTNQQIAREFHGTGGNHAPLLPVVTLPAGSSVSSPAVLAGLRGLEARLQQILPGTRERNGGELTQNPVHGRRIRRGFILELVGRMIGITQQGGTLGTQPYELRDHRRVVSAIRV